MTGPLPSQDQNNSQAIPGDWRERFLQRILVISGVIGIFALIPAVISTNDLVLQSVYIGVFVTLVAAILIKLPYLAKATIFIALPFILGVSSLSETGIRGDSLFFLLAFVTFSALLIGYRSGIIAIIISELVIIVMGYLILNGHYTLSDKLAFEGDLTDWISAAFTQLLISSVVMVGLRMMQEGYDQAKASVENMVDTLRGSQFETEKRVTERTQELAHKTKQLSASTHVIHQIASMQDLDDLLNRTVHLISEQFGFYHTALYLMNIRGDYVVLQAASSEGGKQLMERGYRLRVGTEGIVGLVAAEKKAHIALDVGEDAVFFDAPELSETRSELSIPLIMHSKVIGVLDMQSSEKQAFRYDDIEIFQTMADQIAATIENMRLLTESQLVVSQLDIILNEETRQNWKTESELRKPAFHYSISGLKAMEKPISLKGKNVLDIPLVLRGQKIGKLSLQRKSEFQGWTSQEEVVANDVATQAALALENIRLVERTRERANREQAIAAIAARIRETLDLETVLRTSAREIQRTLNLQEAEVRLIQQNTPDDKEPSQDKGAL
jgi:GAF domain-containing protein